MPETDTTTTTTDDKAGDNKTGTDKGGTTTTGSTGSGGAGGEDLAGLVEKLREENKTAKREAAALRSKASKLDELEAASKTDLEKANDRAAKAETAAAEAATKLLRLEVAAAKGIPAKLAGRLQGTTREEMESDADDLLETVKVDDGRQRKVRTNGNAGDEGGKPSGSMSDWIRGQARRSA